jgi:hypothetical protein
MNRNYGRSKAYIQRQSTKRWAWGWNKRHPIGTEVRYWEFVPFGPTLDTIVTSPAYIAPSGDVVVGVKGVEKFISVTRLRKRSDLAPEQPSWELGRRIDVTGRVIEPTSEEQDSCPKL